MTTVSQQETIEALLSRSGRDNVPLRRSFVQVRQRGGGAGPLSWFVRDRRSRALDLYLLAFALASAPPFDVALPAEVWARMLGLSTYASGRSVVSKNWRWLERRAFITSDRRGRLKAVTLLREDGSGAPYIHPGRDAGDYFKLPYEYWHANFHNRLSLPAKAVLLIALARVGEFSLPAQHASQWYGLSPDSISAGIRHLRLYGLLETRLVTKPAPLTAKGITQERKYILLPPFGAPADR